MTTKRLFVCYAALLVLSGPVYAQEPDDPLERSAKQFGASAGEYAGLSLARHVNIQRLTTELERCVNCAQRADLERELAKLKAEDGAVKIMEGELLQSMGLPYDSFGSLFRALVADFTSGKLTTQQRQDRAVNAFNNMKVPVEFWCRIYQPGDFECSRRFLNKWSQEWRVPISDDFGWEMWRRSVDTEIVCNKSLQALRKGAKPDDSEVRECQAPLLEWARLRNEADAFCIEHGAFATMRDGTVVVSVHRCDNVIRQRDNEKRFPSKPRPKPRRQ